MINCGICDGRFLSHSLSVICKFCGLRFHKNCIHVEIDTGGQWTCEICLTSIFPFNHIEQDFEFIKAVTGSDNVLRQNDLIYNVFNPLDLDDELCIDERVNFLLDIDPDYQFYNDEHCIMNVQNCEYYNETSLLKKTVQNNDYSQCFSVLHFNIRSMPKNLNNFEQYLQCHSHNFKIIGFSETWLSEINSQNYTLSGYNIENNFRINKSGGGVSVCVRHDIEYRLRNDLSLLNSNLESIFIEIPKSEFNSIKTIIVGILYRPPNTAIEEFNDSLNDILKQVITKNYTIYLLGDFNINLLNIDSHSHSSDFLDLMYSYGFMPLINKPTRVTSQSATIIDHIYCNDVHNSHLLNGILVTDITDHYPIFSININQDIQAKTLYFTNRSLCDNNIDTFVDKLRLCDWNDVYTQNNVNDAFQHFYVYFTKTYNECFPVKTHKTGYKNRKTWLTRGLKTSIQNKNMLYLKYRKNDNLENLQKYKTYKSLLNKILRYSEQKYFDDYFLKCKHNLKKIWSKIKTVINKNKQAMPCTEFKIGDQLTSDP